jgi:hypothetical protein
LFRLDSGERVTSVFPVVEDAADGTGDDRPAPPEGEAEDV